MPSLGFAVAASTLVGQNLGARRPDEAEKSGWAAMRLCSYFMGAMGLLFILIPRVFIRIYISDPAVIAPAESIMRMIGLTQLPQAIAFVGSGVLRGAGDTKAVLGITMLGTVVLRLGLSYLFVIVLGWGLWSAFLAVLIDWVIRASLLTYWVKLDKWKMMKV